MIHFMFSVLLFHVIIFLGPKKTFRTLEFLIPNIYNHDLFTFTKWWRGNRLIQLCGLLLRSGLLLSYCASLCRSSLCSFRCLLNTLMLKRFDATFFLVPYLMIRLALVSITNFLSI